MECGPTVLADHGLRLPIYREIPASLTPPGLAGISVCRVGIVVQRFATKLRRSR